MRFSGKLSPVAQHVNSNDEMNGQSAAHADGVHCRRSATGALDCEKTPATNRQEEHNGADEPGVVAAHDDGMSNVDYGVEKRQVDSDQCQARIDPKREPK